MNTREEEHMRHFARTIPRSIISISLNISIRYNSITTTITTTNIITTNIITTIITIIIWPSGEALGGQQLK